MTVPSPDLGKLNRQTQVSRAFTPAAPVGDFSQFAGRINQITAAANALFQAGQHIAVYGERGVGKTSLANVLPAIINQLNSPGICAVRVDCNTTDTFGSVWRKVFRELAELTTMPDLNTAAISDPEDVRFVLQHAGRDVLIVLDELDRMEDDEALSLLADTVKTISDHAARVTLMFVGVAASVQALLGEHDSIVRNVLQIPMKRMSRDELESLLDKGFAQIDGLTVTDAAKDRIVSAAEGLPHFAHLLGLGAAQAAVNDDRDTVRKEDVDAAEAEIIQTHSMYSEYRRATDSNQPGHLYEEVLLSCAYSRRDGIGYFRAADVRTPLSRITGRPMTIPQFQRHLAELSDDTRMTLIREGEKRHRSYRFRNPLFQPFIKMTARTKGIITSELASELQGDQTANSQPALLDAP